MKAMAMDVAKHAEGQGEESILTWGEDVQKNTVSFSVVRHSLTGSAHLLAAGQLTVQGVDLHSVMAAVRGAVDAELLRGKAS